MGNYIEREAVMKILGRYGFTNGSALGRHSGAVEAAEQEISLLPIADVAPVVHGQWEKIGRYHIYNCSICKMDISDDMRRKESLNGMTFRYCPYCGAKMDGGENDG